MDTFTVHHLRVTVEVLTPMLLNEHKGSAIRGALYHALRGPRRPARDGYTGFCMQKQAADCAACPLHAACPVATLVSTLSLGSRWGRDAPRPYIVRPPLDGGRRFYRPGERFTFGLSLFGAGHNLLPYVVLALQRLEHEGMGKRVSEATRQRGGEGARGRGGEGARGRGNEGARQRGGEAAKGERGGRWRRGTARPERIAAVHLLTGEMQEVMAAGETMVQVPNVPVTHADVLEEAERMAADEWARGGELTLHLATPMRLVDGGRLVKEPHFRPLFQRLLERLERLSEAFSDSPLALDFRGLAAAAGEVELVRDGTHWLELESYSTRQQRSTHIGGLVGRATYRAEDWRPFLPWLLWGQVVQVGKDTVKGNGWYEVEWRMGDGGWRMKDEG